MHTNKVIIPNDFWFLSHPNNDFPGRGGVPVGRYVVLDAIDDNACQFYEHYGFTATPRPDRLVRKVSDIEADIKTA
jgi:hypothetical protein